MSRTALIKFHDIPCGVLKEQNERRHYVFTYFSNYQGPAISLTMPVRLEPYVSDRFPPFFDGLLPEGPQLDALLRIHKIDQHDYLRQLIVVGADLVGAVTVLDLGENDALSDNL